jgi:ABC-type transport system involved in cytochrome c biogenesis, ATPase component
MSMEIFVEDWHDLHKGFSLELEPGFTALVGPNGAGKTTMLQQIKEHARKEGVEVWEYSNVRDGGQTARSQYQFTGDIENLAASLTASEGENVALNFSNKVGEIGMRVRRAATEKKPLIVLLDAIDSGASIDRARELRGLFDLIYEQDISKGAEVYIVMAVNSYELAKDPADCVNVRTGKHMRFRSYDAYAKFVCSFEEKFKRAGGKRKKRGG